MGVALASDLSDLSDMSDMMGAPRYTPRVCGAPGGLGGRFTDGVIIAIGAPITQSHKSHNSHNSHIKRRPIGFANRSGYTEFGCKKSPQRYPIATRFFFAKLFFTCGTTHGYSGGCQGDSLVPLTGRATHPTATILFLPSFFFCRKNPTGKSVRDF